MTVITSLTNPVWRDTAVNVEVHGGNGRYVVQWPTEQGMAGAPDFTMFQQAVDYATAVSKAIRLRRELAHERALKQNSAKTTTIDLVLVDSFGAYWVRVAPDRYTTNYALHVPESGWTRAEVEKHSGIATVLHSIEIRGEVVA